jgi:hypothetical protein
VKRSTLNFQRGDRKGAWWAGYGDRHTGDALAIFFQPRSSNRTRFRQTVQHWRQTKQPVAVGASNVNQRADTRFWGTEIDNICAAGINLCPAYASDAVENCIKRYWSRFTSPFPQLVTKI